MTVMLAVGAAREKREVRMAVPISPAPRTRMLEFEPMVLGDMVGVSYGVG